MRNSQHLLKTMLWIFLAATVATAVLNSVKLGRVLWETWQMESMEGSEAGVQVVGTPAIALAHVAR
jgi:hypothetical protein